MTLNKYRSLIAFGFCIVSAAFVAVASPDPELDAALADESPLIEATADAAAAAADKTSTVKSDDAAVPPEDKEVVAQNVN